MISLENTLVCEGKYDKIKLSNLFDAPIITLDGFQIRSHPEKQMLLKIMAAKAPLVLITDSDAAGFSLRRFLTDLLPDGSVIQVYIPDRFGKERRKAQPGKEGKLGVEGIADEEILAAFRAAGILDAQNQPLKVMPEIIPFLTPARLYEDGLLGESGASERRKKLLTALNLPARINTRTLCLLLNQLLNEPAYRALLAELNQK